MGGLRYDTVKGGQFPLWSNRTMGQAPLSVSNRRLGVKT
jgi:hypothetical protein